MLVVNDPRFLKRAEIIREKGTNRSSFFRGEVDKYGWVDIGSSFLPSDIVAAFLFAQLENLDRIQARRREIWEQYREAFSPLEKKGLLKLPHIPAYATNNAHMFYLVCNSPSDRTGLIAHLKDNGVLAVFHYLSLHKSNYYSSRHDGRPLPMSDSYSETLLRLPMYFELTRDDTAFVIRLVKQFYGI